MRTPKPSPLIEAAFLSASALLIALCVLRGWRRGVVRSVILLAAMVFSVLAGMAVGSIVAGVAAGFLPLPAPLVTLGIGVLAAVPIYLSAALLAALLFKRTDQQRSAPLKLLYGAGGAAIGLVFGYLVWWGVVSAVRGAGALAEGEIAARQRMAAAAPPGRTELVLVNLKRSMESGAAGRLVTRLDFTPPGTYRILAKGGEVAASPGALRRTLEYPGVQEILAAPPFRAIVADPEIQEAARRGDWLAILRSPLLLKAANDPALLERLEKVDFEAALDFALAGQGSAGSTPAPTP